MDTELYKPFYDYLMQDGGKPLRQAIALRDMLAELPCYLATRIRDRYYAHCAPFDSVWVWANQVAVIECESVAVCDVSPVIDVECSLEGYVVKLFTRKQSQTEALFRLLGRLPSASAFPMQPDKDGRTKLEFRIDEEQQVYDLIDNLCRDLINMSNHKNSNQ